MGPPILGEAAFAIGKGDAAGVAAGALVVGAF